MSLISMPRRVEPSWKAGFARSSAKSANPGLRKGSQGLWAPQLGPTGSTLFDVSGFGNHGALTNMDSTNWEIGEKGQVLRFSASSSQVVQGNHSNLTFPCSIVCLGKTGSSGTSRFFNVGNIASDAVYFALDINIGNDWSYFFRTGGGSNKVVNVSGSPTANTWYHMVGVSRSSTDHELFVDGVSIGTSSVDSTPSGLNGFGIGALWRLTPIYTDCQVAYCGSYTRALTPNEIQQLYQDSVAALRLRRRVFSAAAADVEPPTGAIMNQLQGSNLGADLFDGTLL